MAKIKDLFENEGNLNSSFIELPALADGQTKVEVSVGILRDCIWQGIKYMMDEVQDLKVNKSRGSVSELRAQLLLYRCYQMAKVHYYLLGMDDKEIEEMSIDIKEMIG